MPIYESEVSCKRRLKTDNGRAYKAKQMRYKRINMPVINCGNVYSEVWFS